MKKLKVLYLGILAVCWLGIAVAQDQSGGAMGPPKVLTITREYVKPGKAGAMHDKAESAFVQAMTRAKWPTHYLGMTSLSGKSRALFLTSYASFEAWEKDAQATQKNAALSAALDRASVVDGELLDSIDAHVLSYNEEYSLNPQPPTAATRLFEFSVFHVKPGHHKEWDEAVKLVLAGYKKGVPEAHWACYEGVYGNSGDTYVFITARKSASEIDQAMARDKDFMAAMGEEGMKKLDELSAATIESDESNLFLMNASMSYPPDEWVKADPDFWKPRMAAAPPAGKKASEKKEPAQ